MNLTDEEIKALDQLICDANEDAFEEFTNNLCIFVVGFTAKMQNAIAKNIRKLFSDRFFVFMVNRYANMKHNNDEGLLFSFKHAATKGGCVYKDVIDESIEINKIKDFIIEFMYAEKLVN